MSPSAAVAHCPAKINLSLRVTGRRPDGYHELDTVFQTIDLWDRLEIRPAKRLELSCDLPGLPVDESNLVLRAARLLLDRYANRTLGASMRLHKTIPAGAGLGGGSSNAAGALLLCNRFWNLHLDRPALAGLGAELGADVPFFLTGGTARGRGRGDRVEALPFVGNLSILLGLPPYGISTAEVYRRLNPRLTLQKNGVSVPLLSALKWPKEKDLGFPANDLETIVFEGWPELLAFRDALLGAGAGVALLSGSGSTVYGIFPERESLDAARRRLGDGFPTWAVRPTRAIEGAAHVEVQGVGNGEPSCEG